MITETFITTNRSGLHARPAARFVTEARKYKSDITLAANGKTGSGKSVISILSMCITRGTEYTLTINGEDEQAAYEALNTLIQAGFYE